MACWDASDQCMVTTEGGTPHEQPACCDWMGGGPHFSDLYRFVPTHTGGHQCCFVGVLNQTGGGCGVEERDRGNYCGYGCEICDDAYLNEMVDYIDGDRWLRAEWRLRQRYWDAKGVIHDLRSNEYHPIPGKIMYERGTCWENNGRECFQEDSCVCFGENSPHTSGQVSSHRDGLADYGCGGDLPYSAGDSIDGVLFPDPLFRTGYRWPPTTMAGAVGYNYQLMEFLYCRKFWDGRKPFREGGGHDWTRVLIDPTKTGGLSGITEPMFDPVLMSSNTCNSDRMVHCTGRMATNSMCWGYSAWGEFHTQYPYTPAHLAFYNQDSASRTLFNYLSINEDNTARIRGASDSEGLSGPTAEWKNGVLDIIKTATFETPIEGAIVPEPLVESLLFDRLDHMHAPSLTNKDLGVYRREWHADHVFFMVKVPNGSGTGRLRLTGCIFDYDTYLTHVKIEARVILPQVKQWGGRYRIEPLIRFHIIGVVRIHAYNLRGGTSSIGDQAACWVMPWNPEGECEANIPMYSITRDIRWLYPCREPFNIDFCHYPKSLPSRRDVRGRVKILDEWPEWPELCATPPEAYFEYPTGHRISDILGSEPWDQPESLMFFNSDGKQFIPDRLVEWRGMSGGHSNPKSEDQRFDMGDLGGSCQQAVEGFNRRTIVPGWPTHVDTHPDDPQQIYGGHVRLKFVL